MMILEKIKSDGLAHLSYLLGDEDEVIVIDPRRDCDVYGDVGRTDFFPDAFIPGSLAILSIVWAR